MPCQSQSPWLDLSNYVWRGVQVMKLLVMQFPTEGRNTHQITWWNWLYLHIMNYFDRHNCYNFKFRE
jgi:hypothetical protein